MPELQTGRKPGNYLGSASCSKTQPSSNADSRLAGPDPRMVRRAFAFWNVPPSAIVRSKDVGRAAGGGSREGIGRGQSIHAGQVRLAARSVGGDGGVGIRVKLVK